MTPSPVHTLHLVDKIFYGDEARRAHGEVAYASPAEKGGAMFYPTDPTDADNNDVFKYFASLVLLAPTETGSTYKDRIEATWTAKQSELFKYLADDDGRNQQIEWWKEDMGILTQALSQKFPGNAPQLSAPVSAVVTPEPVPVVTPKPPGPITPELSSLRQQMFTKLVKQIKGIVGMLGEVDDIYGDMIELGVSNNVLENLEESITSANKVTGDHEVRLQKQVTILRRLLANVSEAMDEVADDYESNTRVMALVGQVETLLETKW